MKQTISIILASFLCLGAISSTAQAQAPNFTDVRSQPTDAHGKILINLLEAGNSGDFNVIKKFLMENAAPDFLDLLPIEEHVGRIAGIAGENGGFDFYSLRQSKVTESDKNVREMIIKGRASKDWFQVMVSFSDDKLPKITSLGAKGIPPQASN